MTPRPDLDHLGRRLGSTVRRATAVPWGDRRATWRLDLEDGRSMAARVMSGPGAQRRAGQLAEIVARGTHAGLALAAPMDLFDDGPSTWLVSPWIAGQTGASLLDGDGGVPLARTMGALASRLATIPVDGLDLDGPWVLPATLRAAAGSWIEAVHGSVDAPTREHLQAAIDRVASERTFDDHGTRPLLRHGDFAPINVIVEPGGQAVLLDFEHARASALPIDVAWWAWVVDHHHPAAWRRIGASFLAAADVPDDEITRRRLADMALLLLLERAAGAAEESDAEQTVRWIERLVQAATRVGLPAYDPPTT